MTGRRIAIRAQRGIGGGHEIADRREPQDRRVDDRTTADLAIQHVQLHGRELRREHVGHVGRIRPKDPRPERAIGGGVEIRPESGPEIQRRQQRQVVAAHQGLAVFVRPEPEGQTPAATEADVAEVDLDRAGEVDRYRDRSRGHPRRAVGREDLGHHVLPRQQAVEAVMTIHVRELRQRTNGVTVAVHAGQRDLPPHNR